MKIRPLKPFASLILADQINSLATVGGCIVAVITFLIPGLGATTKVLILVITLLLLLCYSFLRSFYLFYCRVSEYEGLSVIDVRIINEQRTILCSNPDTLNIGDIVTIFRYEDKVETPLALGQVRHIQEKLIQVTPIDASVTLPDMSRKTVRVRLGANAVQMEPIFTRQAP